MSEASDSVCAAARSPSCGTQPHPVRPRRRRHTAGPSAAASAGAGHRELRRLRLRPSPSGMSTRSPDLLVGHRRHPGRGVVSSTSRELLRVAQGLGRRLLRRHLARARSTPAPSTTGRTTCGATASTASSASSASPRRRTCGRWNAGDLCRLPLQASLFRTPTPEQVEASLAVLEAEGREVLLGYLLSTDEGLGARVGISYEQTLDREPDDAELPTGRTSTTTTAR